ncbi:GspH/FimT family pseudopilin [Dyella silvae]|uniref:GspH/FimT family pseudopilin n=1 Tax=Dyella silvae TaxID=2994424 RepID=UPI002263B6F4|nr:GspH/FimT family pseudopilin [Dyella silvae]
MQVLSRQRSASSGVVRNSISAATQVSSRRKVARADAQRFGRGFTILELMVSLAVAGVLLIIAVPSFSNMILTNRLTTVANDMVAAINTARMEAIKRNANTQFCSNLAASNQTDTLGAACTTQTGAVYVTTGTAGTTQVLSSTASLTTPVQLSGNVVALRFTSQGIGQQAGTTAPFGAQIADICTSKLSSNNHRQIWMAAGSILEVTQSTGACP